MSDVLNEIVRHKRKEVDSRKKRHSLPVFQNELKKSTRSLYNNIYEKSANQNQPAYILECKKASPSKGLINEGFDIESIVGTYDEYASGISVLTDSHFFQGAFEYIEQAKKITNLPILCKDFFIDSYQVYEARYFGADAILLMLSVLDDETYIKLSKVAREFDLDILTEVHDELELNRALDLNASIIGINNRNLKDLSISLSTTKLLAPKIASKLKTAKRPLIISESGISCNQDVVKLSSIVDGFLVGSHLMASKNLKTACQKLRYGNIKICGLTQQKDIEDTKELGATFAGLIFYKKSPRYIEPSLAEDIIENIDLQFIGVFVNEKSENIINIANQLKLYAVQLHGNESDKDIIKLKQALPNIEIWNAMPVNSDSTAESLAVKINQSPADKILLDTQTDTFGESGYFGGTGIKFDWQIIENLGPLLTKSKSLSNNIILAGGLSPENIIQAKRSTCFAFDVNSGVEKSPGIKSKEKIKLLFNKIATRN